MSFFVRKKMKEKDLKIIKQECEQMFSINGACPNHPEVTMQKLEPRMFSFNSPFGACPVCQGLGELMKVDPDLVVPDRGLSIMGGAIKVYGKMDEGWRFQQIKAVGDEFGFDLFMPIKNFTEEQLNVLLYGTDKNVEAYWHTGAKMLQTGWEGIINQTERLFKETQSDYRKKILEKFFKKTPCPKCKGKRLKPEILSVKIKEKSIINVCDLSIEECLKFFENLSSHLSKKEMIIAKQVLKEIIERLAFLNNVGLGYLTLSRSAGTLSGGEAQRIRLATQIGSNLTGVLYILDEPSIGLHQRDNQKLIDTLHKLRDLGNTLIVVEHDEDTMIQSDYIVDIGKGAGIHGGNVVAIGTPKEICKNKDSLTGEYLSGKKTIEIPKKRREVNL
jgi:excinuclease ABC subunit A